MAILPGMRLGGLTLEAQDVEVLTRDYLLEYFITRDITQNEALVLKVAPNKTFHLYTQQVRSAWPYFGQRDAYSTAGILFYS